MANCPSCNKKIGIKVSGKYTCSCGESLPFNTETKELVKNITNSKPIKERILNLKENLLVSAFILFGIACFAWDSDLPELFGKYSDPIWLVISYIFLFCCSIFFLILILILYLGISENDYGIKNISILIGLLVVDFGFILHFLYKVGLIEFNIPIIGALL